MPRILKAKEVCERSLRKINAFSINDTAADPEHLKEALFWMDMVVAEIVGTNKCFWLIPATIDIPLTANTQTYDLADAMGSALPDDGNLFPTAAYVSITNSDNSVTNTPVDIISRTDYNAIVNKTTSGCPNRIYIDRLDEQSFHPYPVPADTSYTLHLDVQSYSPDMTKDGGGKAHGLSAEWNLWLVLATAAQIGNGPIRRLSGNVIVDIRQEAQILRDRLLAYSNTERPGQTGLRRTKGWGV